MIKQAFKHARSPRRKLQSAGTSVAETQVRLVHSRRPDRRPAARRSEVKKQIQETEETVVSQVIKAARSSDDGATRERRTGPYPTGKPFRSIDINVAPHFVCTARTRRCGTGADERRFVAVALYLPGRLEGALRQNSRPERQACCLTSKQLWRSL